MVAHPREPQDVAGGFYKVNVDSFFYASAQSVTTSHSILRTLQQATTCLWLANSRDLPKSCYGTGFGLLSATKIFLDCYRLLAAIKDLCGSWAGQPPRCPECLWQCSSRWAGWHYKELRGMVGDFYKVNAFLAPKLLLGPQSPHKNALRIPRPATACLRPAGF